MNLSRNRFLHLAAGAAALPAVSRIARAQTYPTRPITIVVPFPTGGPNDMTARIIAERMRSSLGQPVIVENVSGANGSIGVGRVTRAAPDGYTLSLGSASSHVMNGAIYALAYDLMKDLQPVSVLVLEPQMFIAKRTMPANDLGSLIAWLKANPDKALLGTQGIGNMGHIVGVLFQNVTGSRFQFVPYRGSAPAMQDLIAGQIDMMIDSPAAAVPMARAGAIKAYAVTGTHRLLNAPNIPTADEAGLSGFYASNWRGLWAPKGTPKDIIAKLDLAVVDALADPVVRSRFDGLGLEIAPRQQQTPEALAALQKAEIEKWWPIIKAAGIKAE
jgi:tripartite-type tricarboxylate transporter receptor subunit TctC